MIFCNDLGEIRSDVSARSPGDQTFILEEHLKKFVNAYSISENNIKRWNTSGKEFTSEGAVAAYIARTISFIYSLHSYKAAFDCS